MSQKRWMKCLLRMNERYGFDEAVNQKKRSDFFGIHARPDQKSLCRKKNHFALCLELEKKQIGNEKIFPN